MRALVNTQGEITATNDALGTINETKYDDLGNQIEDLGRNIKVDLIKPVGEELKPVQRGNRRGKKQNPRSKNHCACSHQ